MNQSKESLIEDALARLLAIAYYHAKNDRETNKIGRDEGILRDALFGGKTEANKR